MKFRAALWASALLALGSTSIATPFSSVIEEGNSNSIAPSSPPVNYGILVFPAFQALDVFGPLDALNLLSLQFPLNLTIISKSLAPVTTRPSSPAMNLHNSNFSETVVPTHTLHDLLVAADGQVGGTLAGLEVLIVPGGMGTRAPDLQPEIKFIKDVFPSLRYLITVCTGAGMAARAGVLDGRNATTNKRSWASTIVHGPKTNWITHARWVVDGNIWTSSGVAAGIDATLAFIGDVYGASIAQNLANGMEYQRWENASYDPFADLYGL